ncbi:hypothetical protein OC842_006715 [Tilletia horrida]|uniref:Uncharacterized protein n=1 Tax=Tilletia horrida TaxID=155126 RepID=A0AAN6JN44_9BASI|nr:hypothetical protein OC842_006715 [Tilletia horrida]KAK0553255.1 hypothetical protein OC844_006320 [Tilletia horrida]
MANTHAPSNPTLEDVVRLLGEWRAENAAIVARTASLEREMRGLDLRFNVLNRIISGLLTEQVGDEGNHPDDAVKATGRMTAGEDPVSPSSTNRRPGQPTSVGQITPSRGAWQRSSSDATEEDSESSLAAHITASFEAKAASPSSPGNIGSVPDDQTPFECSICD